MRRIATAALCLVLFSCGGEDQCSSGAQKSFLRSWTDNLYLWYREVPASDPAQYPGDPAAYFDQLKTPLKTSSGKDKDQFHFHLTTADWRALSQTGVQAGYGVTWALLAPTPPRKALAAYNEPGSPAVTNGVIRGVEVLTVDGVDLVNANDQASVDKLNAGLFPTKTGETHSFGVRDPGGATRTVTMTSQNVTSAPVQNVSSIPTPTGNVGYMLFNDHLATAERALVDAVNQLKAASITDLVLDIRYNGGGYLAIASELAYMIAGPARTSGKAFEQITFNDKHPTTDPVTGQTLTPAPFYSQGVGLSVNQGVALPSLGLGRLFVLTGSSTCSASESILNGLSGIDVEVIQIGGTTCGKPYGFYPQDLCGTTYFSIEFQGVNAKGFGDYPDGFAPGAATAGSFVGCPVTDDFGHALGDPNEARLAAALAWRTSPACAVAPAMALVSGGLRGEGKVVKSPWQENRIALPTGR